MSELILTEDVNRFVLYPIKHSSIFDMYKIATSSFWVCEEVDLSKDINDWNNKLTDNEKLFIENILAFFAGADGIVNENLAQRFYNDVKIPEARAFYSFQMAIETIHSEMYSLMIDTYIKDNQKRKLLFNAINTIPSIAKKAQWAQKWIENSEAPFAMRLVAFAIVEGVFFSGAFASIYWLKERNLMPGLCTSNELISRDEGLHTEFAVLLYSMLSDKLTQTQINDIFTEAVEIETEFIIESIPCKLLGINSDLMSDYIKFVADRLIVQLGYSKLYNIKNPLDFMDRISLSNKTSFFEHRPTEYSKAGVGNKDNHTFSLDEDF